MATGDDPLAPPSEQVTAPPSSAPPSPPLAPHGSTAIQAGAPTGISSAPIPLPAAPVPVPVAPPDLGALARRLYRFEVVLVALLLALAFLTASYPVTNSDFFLHLATGRLLAQGQHTFGVDPFTYTSEGYWVNHAWLYDLLLYLLYQLPSGGAVLVVLKGLLLAAVAGLMLLSAQRAGQPRWIPLACVFLALLALSARLFFQPVLFSYFFLALTLYLLLSSPHDLRRAWLVPAVCVLWVNFDEWFLLGPLAVALYALGRLLDRRFGDQPAEANSAPPSVEELRTLGFVFGASVLAGLLNPHFLRAFALPSALGLSEAARALQDDPEFGGAFISPWEKRYVLPRIGLSAAGLAYYVLVAIGLTSFAVTFGAWRWWRVLLWLGFGLLGSVNLRTIPLFAVVAGPIAALNFLDFAAWLRSRAPGGELLLDRAWRRWAFLGRGLTVLAALVLLVATWPGWLQAQPHRARRGGWSVQPDASLVALAEKIKAWQEEGKIAPGQNWFNTSPEVGNYFAWYCPGERCFLDHRLPLFGKVAADYALIRKQLSTDDAPADVRGEKGAPPAWERPFEQHDVRFVVFHTRDLYQFRALVMLAHLFVARDEWEACYGEGNAAVFGWAGPLGKRNRASFAPLALDYDRQAFGPDCVPAPPSGSRPAEHHPWYAELYLPPPLEPMESGTAVLNFWRFEFLQRRYEDEHTLDFERVMLASLVGTSANQGDSLMNGVPLNGLALARINSTFWQGFHRMPPPPEGARLTTKSDGAFFQLAYEPYFRAQEKGPTASLYLAVRAARQALAKSPDESRPYLVLAQAYTRLAHASKEPARVRELVRTPQGPRMREVVPHVWLIRQTQIAYALNQVLQSGPRPEAAQQAHLLLAQLYSQGGPFFELQVRHEQAYLKLSKELKRLVGPIPPDKQGEAIERLEKSVKARQTDLDDRQNKYELKSANKKALLKAQYALREGLAATAIDVLLAAPVEELEDKQPGGVGRPGVTMLLSLLLATGRLPEVAQALLPTAENEDTFNRAAFGVHPTLQLPAYEWFMVQYAAGIGDYEQVDKSLQELLAKTKRSPQPYAALVRLGAISPRDAIDQSGAPRLGTVGDLAALSLGHFVLGKATHALRPPTLLGRLFPPPDLGARLQAVQGLLAEEAMLHVVRAWLALEAGTLARARGALGDADRITVIDHGKRGRLLVPTPSLGLQALCRELLARGEGKAKR